MTIVDDISNVGILPVISIERAADAVPLGRALMAAGLPAAEITFRTAAAAEAIRLMTDAFPEMLVGAGTVLTSATVDAALDAGATFMVSPGLNPDVVRHCQSRAVPIFPGICTPTEIEAALVLGLEVVKFFPAESYGGLKTLKAMSAPYGGVRFMPTGGINTGNVTAYLNDPKVVACGGSWMVSPALINDGKFDEIEALARAAAALVLDARKG